MQYPQNGGSATAGPGPVSFNGGVLSSGGKRSVAEPALHRRDTVSDCGTCRSAKSAPVYVQRCARRLMRGMNTMPACVVCFIPTCASRELRNAFLAVFSLFMNVLAVVVVHCAALR